jgi:hypothetical protein
MDERVKRLEYENNELTEQIAFIENEMKEIEMK